MDWNSVPSEEIINSTVENMNNRNFNTVVVANKEEALEKLKSLIPEGSEIANGSSTTLNQIGYIDYLKENNSKYNNLSEKALSENDEVKRAEIRKKAIIAEYFVSSVNAVSQNGELVAADLTGSRTGAFPFGAQNLIIVVGANKIAKDLDSAIQRVREFVFPLENERAQKAYGMPSAFGKWVIMEKEIVPNRVQVILIKEALGF